MVRKRQTRNDGKRRMNHDSYPDSYIRGILITVKTIALVGASINEIRPSYCATQHACRMRRGRC